MMAACCYDVLGDDSDDDDDDDDDDSDEDDDDDDDDDIGVQNDLVKGMFSGKREEKVER